MGANTISEALRQSGNNRFLERHLIASPTAIAIYMGVITKKSRVKKVRGIWAVAATGETMDVRVIRSGTNTAAAAGVGTRIIASTFDLTGTAGTMIEKDAASGSASILNEGDRVFCIPSGTATNLSGAEISVELEPLE